MRFGHLLFISILTLLNFGNPRAQGDAILQGQKAPWRSIGRLEKFRIKDSKPLSSCTATVISTNLLLTAAHCVALDEDYGKTWGYRFLPMLQFGLTLYPIEVANAVSLKQVETPDHEDLGIARTVQPIGDVTGAVPLVDYTPDIDDGAIFWNVGYGASLNAQSATVFQDKSSFELADVKLLFFGAPVEAGMSGGPMLGWFGNQFKIIGVNSGKQVKTQYLVNNYRLSNYQVTTVTALSFQWGLIAKVAPILNSVGANIKHQVTQLRDRQWAHFCNFRTTPVRVAAGYGRRDSVAFWQSGWQTFAAGECRFLINDQRPPYVMRVSPLDSNRRLALTIHHGVRPEVPARRDLCLPNDGLYEGDDSPCGQADRRFAYFSGEDIGLPAAPSHTAFVSVSDGAPIPAGPVAPAANGSSDKPTRAPESAREF